MHKIFHPNCLLCGKENPWSFGMIFGALDDKSVYGQFQGHDKLQGYNGILHGGVITALLDSAMTHCLFKRGIQAVTAELSVRFLKPILWDAKVEVKACIIFEKKPLYRLKAEIIYKKQLMATATAKFMLLPD